MRPGTRSRMGFWCAAAVAVIVAAPVQAIAQAQDYPNKPVTFVTPAAAGNSPDVVTRIVADKLTQLWKQQIVVINRPGAGGLIAAQAAAALPKDGYSIYMTQASTWTVLPIQQEGKMPFDLHKSFVPIGMVGEQHPAALRLVVRQADTARQPRFGVVRYHVTFGHRASLPQFALCSRVLYDTCREKDLD